MKLKSLNKDEWNTLIKEYFIPTPFHTFEWLNILSETWPETKIYFFSIEDEKENIGLLPVIAKKRLGLRLMGSPLGGYYTPYLGPILRDYNNFIYSSLIKCLIQKLSPDFLEISFPTGLNINLEGTKTMSTVLIDLTKGEDFLWKNMKKETRSQVRQAKKLGVETFSPTELESWLSDYYSAVTCTYSRQGLPNPAPKNFYERVWQELYPKGILKVILAKYEGRIIAGSFNLIWQGVIYGIDGVSFYEYRKLRPNNLVEWETISWATKAGLLTYDMIGANIPSIAKFKVGFGGNITEHQTLRLCPTIGGKLAWKVYDRFRVKIKNLMKV